MSDREISVTISERQANDIAGLLAELSHPDDGGLVDLADLLDTLAASHGERSEGW